MFIGRMSMRRTSSPRSKAVLHGRHSRRSRRPSSRPSTPVCDASAAAPQCARFSWRYRDRCQDVPRHARRAYGAREHPAVKCTRYGADGACGAPGASGDGTRACPSVLPWVRTMNGRSVLVCLNHANFEAARPEFQLQPPSSGAFARPPRKSDQGLERRSARARFSV
jgi:hypothetical protein